MLFKESQFLNLEQTKEREKMIELAEKTISDIDANGLSIGSGKTATVMVLEQRNDICLKIVDKNRSRSNHVNINNNVNDELSFLDKLSSKQFLKELNLAQEKIVPKPFLSKKEFNREFLFMEQIKGSSLEDILKDKKNMSQNINWELFFSKLENIIQKLHTHNIYHRDLHAGNIMINENHEPIIIDFGNAYESFFVDENPYREELGTRTITYKSDEENIQQLKKLFL